MAQENLAGRTVANYRLLERIGEGGTATVYRAEHPEHGTCAVKILKQRLRTDPTAVKRFLREAGYGGRVQHPCVVSTYEYGDEDELYYLALEWAQGEPLSDFVHRSGKLAPPLVVHIIGQLADALSAAHEAGIIHRDLKPENIMYHADTKGAKLLDFGIARDAEMDPAQRLTRTGFFVGTLQYVAPETLSGELVGIPADIYSLATITYYLLTVDHPYDGKSPRELFQQLLTADPLPLNRAGRGHRLPTALEAAVMQGLARDPKDRPPTVAKFAEGLASGLENEDGKATKGGLMGAFKALIGKRAD
jgi:serine/threonine-protein kinase